MKNDLIKLALLLILFGGIQNRGTDDITTAAGSSSEEYEFKETRELVELVKDAAGLLESKGKGALDELRVRDSRWRRGESYIFVLDLQGNMLVHADKAMEGKNQLDLKDVNGKAIVLGIISAATKLPEKPEGWYHYQWPVPGGLLPRWKSTYVRLVKDPLGVAYIVGSGVYNDRMEKIFVVDLVKDAVGQIEQSGEAAFELLRDASGPFAVKDAYVFVIDLNGLEIVNPGFRNLEGRNILEVKDSKGKSVVREMIEVVQERGAGWLEYQWPKPGESVSTLKSTYVSKANLGEKALVVGCGVYLADAPETVERGKKLSAAELIALVRDGTTLLEKEGEAAFVEFRKRGSKWFHGDIYFFARTMDEKSLFHAADPALEGQDLRDVPDVLGRHYGKMFLKAATSAAGEGWVHYMFPEPGSIFPSWKSTFVKLVNLPSGKQCILGCGVYNMEMDEAFIKDIVDRAAALIAERGKEAFGELRDRTGPFMFMDTYVFVNEPDGTELVNPGHPSMEGKQLINLRDVHGKQIIRDYIEAALKEGSAWVDYYWYKPGKNTPAQKRAYVRKVEFGSATYIVGSGYYLRESGIKDAVNPLVGNWKLVSWESRAINGEISYPFGESPIGSLSYDVNGKMSAFLMRRDRPAFKSGDMLLGTAEEIKAAFEGLLAYFGTYTFDPASKTVTHRVEGCSFPNFVGTDLKRYVNLSGARLELRPESLPLRGQSGSNVLVWERID